MMGAELGLITEAAKPKLKRPPLYKVLLLNDDYTPIEFVVNVLERFFGWGWRRPRRLCWRCTRAHAECRSAAPIPGTWHKDQVRAGQSVRAGEQPSPVIAG